MSEVQATVRLMQEASGTPAVPLEILVRVLSGLQQVIYLAAIAQEHRTIGLRFRPSQEIQQRYRLSCQVPRSGSYVMPVSLGADDVQTSLLTNYAALLQQVENLFSALQMGNFDALVDIFPDAQVRGRILREIRKSLPKLGEGWQLGFQQSDRPEVVVMPERVMPFIDRALDQDVPEDTIMTVTGELIRIDFDRRTLVLRYPPTRREIECVYVDELEETLIENRRSLIQATGQFTLDEDDNPIKLTDVTRLEPVDLSPISLKVIHWQHREFHCTPALLLQPILDEESQQLYVVEVPDLTLHAYAQTREHLLQEISDQIAFLWDTYVEAPAHTLAADALQLREQLLASIQKVSRHAA